MKYCCYLAVFFFVHNVCYAWGLKGHRIVAEIANHRLTDKSKLAVSDILGHSNLAKISNTILVKSGHAIDDSSSNAKFILKSIKECIGIIK